MLKKLYNLLMCLLFSILRVLQSNFVSLTEVTLWGFYSKVKLYSWEQETEFYL